MRSALRLLMCAVPLVGAPLARAAKPPPLGEDAPVPVIPAPPLPGPLRPPQDARASASGTGFLVADGRILTANHVVANCRSVVARNARGERQGARVNAADSARDLAVLSVGAGFGPALDLREDPPVQRGERVVTYGFPLSGLLSSGPTLTTGEVSALAGLRDDPRNFQISAPVQPGNSGGPLLDAQGHVIGIVVSKLNAARVADLTGGDIPQNVNFAIKGTEAIAFLQRAGVPPNLAPSSGAELRASEIGALANPATVFLQCYR